MRNAFLLFMIFFLKIGSSQVPNSSFENWTNEKGWEMPTEWKTNNVTNSISVLKTTQLTEGNFSMKVISNGPSFEGRAPGLAYTTLLPSSKFNLLQLAYKIDSITSMANVEIVVTQLFNEKFEKIGSWKSDTTSNIEKLNIPLTPINNDSLRIEIRANSILTSLGFAGYSEITIDDIKLDLVSKANNFIQTRIIAYPNPSTGLIYLKNCNNCIFQIYDLNGQLINEGKIENRQIEIKKNGLFILKIFKNDISTSELIQIKTVN